jgi:DNA-binding response OmpR family regulator
MHLEARLPITASVSHDWQHMHARTGPIRYLSMNDLHRDARDSWLLGAFGSFEQHTFVDLETRFLSIAEHDYETLIIGGNDPVRAARFLRINRPILARKVKIALMHGSLAGKRAKALNAGFDDVFDSARMSAEEAMARNSVMLARYEAAAHQARAEQELASSLDRVAHVHLLGKRERQLLALLASRLGEPVSHYKLRTELSHGNDELSYNYLKVLASNLRAKLKPPYALVPGGQGSYKIKSL